MMLRKLTAAAALAVTLAAYCAPTDTIVKTPAYTWTRDTIYQYEYKAWAESPEKLQSTYHARPGYYMPISQTWERRNDLSQYPQLTTDNTLHTAIWNMSLDEMVNAVEPDTTLRTGKEWAGVWTRDVSYSIIPAMALLQPEASMHSLLKKVNAEGQIVQDTGSGGAWPISTDRMVWVLAAWEVYKATGSREWLETVYPIALRSIEKDATTVMSADGLVKGETSFIDWREQSYPKWMQTADIAESEAFNTNVMYAAALKACADMASTLGHKNEAKTLTDKADALRKAIDRYFWMDDKGYYAMYRYGRLNPVLNPRAETLGHALAILYDVVPADRARSVSENHPVTPFGPPIFYPQIADMPSYHNNALWPWVAAYWTLAQARMGNEQGVLEGIGSVWRPAALFATNKENLNLDNGDIYTELNSSNMLWCLSGNIALTMRILFGLELEPEGIRIAPFVPESLDATRTLSGIKYRDAVIDITVSGYGAKVKRLTVNGREVNPTSIIPAKKLKGNVKIEAEMDNLPINPMRQNSVANLKAPLTPMAWIEQDPASGKALLRWNPIEYIAEYEVIKDGKPVGRTRQTQWPLDGEAEWQVVGIAADGTPGFASEPRSNLTAYVFEPEGEKTAMESSEISYQPASNPTGWSGRGFAETDHKTAPVTFNFDVPSEGDYALSVRYANGNGPVNTENKAAIRAISIDGERVGTLVMPQRGVANWDDWGTSTHVKTRLTPGRHTVTLEFTPDAENMNLLTNHALIDRLTLTQM